jgi:ParB-like chromosome segregation protein Spo0J
MNIVIKPLADLKPYESNPRINDHAVNAVANSLKEFGWRQPIVVDEQGVIVVGHTRLKAALKLGWTEAPVHVATGLSPEQLRAYRIADNQTAAIAEWDNALLSGELLALDQLGVDLSLLGWSESELRDLMHPAGAPGLVDPDDVPLPPDAATTQPGDLWILGDHRLLCGDSGSVTDLDRLLAGATVSLVNTDPPYNVKVEPRSNNAIAAGLSSFQASNTKPQTHHQSMDLARHPEKGKPTQKKLRAKDRPLANDFVTDEAFDELLDAWFGNIARVLKPGGSFY